MLSSAHRHILHLAPCINGAYNFRTFDNLDQNSNLPPEFSSQLSCIYVFVCLYIFHSSSPFIHYVGISLQYPACSNVRYIWLLRECVAYIVQVGIQLIPNLILFHKKCCMAITLHLYLGLMSVYLHSFAKVSLHYADLPIH